MNDLSAGQKAPPAEDDASGDNDTIRIRGARQNNLKNLDLSLIHI